MKTKRNLRKHYRAQPKTPSCFWRWPWGHIFIRGGSALGNTIKCKVPWCKRTRVVRFGD